MHDQSPDDAVFITSNHALPYFTTRTTFGCCLHPCLLASAFYRSSHEAYITAANSTMSIPPPHFFFFTTPRGTRLVITASHRALHTKVASQSEACGGAAWSGIHASSTRGCDWHDAARPALQLCLLLVNRHLSLTHLPSSKTTQYLCHRMQRRLIAALFVRLRSEV